MTQSFEVFPNPPIIEAVIELITALPPEVSAQHLGSIESAIRDRYPQRQEMTLANLRMEAGSAGMAVATDSRPAGHKFVSNDGKQIVQFRVNGFAFSRLTPYRSFDQFASEARELWEKYKTIARPLRVTRLGLRYINRIDIPLPLSDFSEYLLTRPDLGANIPHGVSELFMRLVLPAGPNRGITLMETIGPGANDGNRLPLVLDIDAFENMDEQPITNTLWERLEHLRFLKNDVFFKSITQKTKELFR